MAYNLMTTGSTLPMIQIQAVTPTFYPTVVNQELQLLLKEVEQLRADTSEITCKCNNPDCPFSNREREGKIASVESEEDEEEEVKQRSPDLGFGSMETIKEKSSSQQQQQSNRHSLQNIPFRLSPAPPRHSSKTTSLSSNISTSLTNIPRGTIGPLQRRADGTIVENDYPGFYNSERCSNNMRGGFSMTHLNRLDVMPFNVEDCQVDQDGLINSSEDYMFSREAPERKLVKSAGRKRSLLEHSNSNPLSSTSRKLSLSIARQSSAGAFPRKGSVPTVIIESISSERLFRNYPLNMDRYMHTITAA